MRATHALVLALVLALPAALPAATADPVGVAAGEDEDASGTYVAVSLRGDAQGGLVAASGTGDAAGYVPVSVLGTCQGDDCVAATPSGPAQGYYLAVSPDGEAEALVAASGSGPADGRFLSVSLTGPARSCETFHLCAAFSGTGSSSGFLAVAVDGPADACPGVTGCTGLSVLGNASGSVAVAPTGYADGNDAQAGSCNVVTRVCTVEAGDAAAVDPGGDASGGFAAVAPQGSAECQEVGCVAVAGDDARCASPDPCVGAVSLQGNAACEGLCVVTYGTEGASEGDAAVAGSATGPADALVLGASVTGDSSGFYAVSGTGEADGRQRGVSGCETARSLGTDAACGGPSLLLP